MFSKVSVLVPTRKRLGFLDRMLQTYDATVDDPSTAELVFRIDSDDTDSIEYLRQRSAKIIIGPRQEGYKSLPAFFNDMAAVASGDLLLCCNDDVAFRTPGWPGLLLAEARKYPDGIFNFGVNVGLNDDKFPFSIVSRQLVRALGFINDERLLFSDVFLLDVARRFDRAIRVESVTIFHDWAGHGNDETRRDANKHEFTMVFRDATGDWTEAYRAKHEQAVAEAIDKIRRAGPSAAEMALTRFESYVPPIGRPAGVWPPARSCSQWKTPGIGGGIHYARSEAAQIIEEIYRQGADQGQAVVTSFTNGLSNLLWAQVFSRLLSVRIPPAAPPVKSDGHCIMSGNLGETKFLYSIIDRLDDCRALIIDDRRYSTVMSTYFLLGQHLKRPGIVIFTPTADATCEESGARRFVNDLRTGAVDNRRHLVADVVPENGGPGMSYEVFL